jgi:cell shape-determining protein MreC
LSPITKLFVALHVLVSAMLVAGVIVFVNKQEDFRATATAATAAQQRAEKQRADETNAMTAEVATYKQNITALTSTIDNLKQQLAQAQQKTNEQAAAIADASSKATLQLAENAKLAEGMKASQDAQTKLNDAVAELRKNLDTRVTEASQLNARISDLTNQLDVSERERRFAVEQLTQARADIERLGTQAKAAGVELDSPTAVAAGAKVGPPINGVIREVDTIHGALFATISVGSADSVTKGMQFNVVERGTGRFLGLLTVTAVEANESTGRIAGPGVASIAPGAEVKTQL